MNFIGALAGELIKVLYSNFGSDRLIYLFDQLSTVFKQPSFFTDCSAMNMLFALTIIQGEFIQMCLFIHEKILYKAERIYKTYFVKFTLVLPDIQP